MSPEPAEPVPARLAHVDPEVLAWAYDVAGGDWRRVVARGEGIAVANLPQVHRTEIPPVRRRPRRDLSARPRAGRRR